MDIKELVKKAREKKEAAIAAQAPKVPGKDDARKAAAKRLMAALEGKNESEFLSALSDLSTISEED